MAAKTVSLEGIRLNATIHVGDGRRFKGPSLDEEGNVLPGETIDDVHPVAAKAIIDNRLARVVAGGVVAEEEAPEEA